MEDIIRIIRNAKSAVILPHLSADGDAIGSCCAMQYVLKSMGIPCVIYTEEELEDRLRFISDDIEIYDGTAIEYDTCIVLDCGDIERVGKRSVLVDNAKAVVNIDHHKTNTGFGDASLVMADASATGEVLFGLFKEMNIKFTTELAGYLYTAICSDTGGFAYSNVSAHTFKIAAELVLCGINNAEISRQLFDCVDISSELLKAELTKKINSYYDGKVRTVAVSDSFAKEFDLKPNEVDGLVDIPRRIRGTEIAVAFKEVNGKIRVSLRSNGVADVSKIALELGGGGHVKAAGCSVEGKSIEEAEKLVVEICKSEIR